MTTTEHATQRSRVAAAVSTERHPDVFRSPRITGQDGRTLPWNRVFAGWRNAIRPHEHSIATTTGYVVRATNFDGHPHRDAASFTADGYGDALIAARWLRTNTTGYAVIDRVYACGCRAAG